MPLLASGTTMYTPTPTGLSMGDRITTKRLAFLTNNSTSIPNVIPPASPTPIMQPQEQETRIPSIHNGAPNPLLHARSLGGVIPSSSVNRGPRHSSSSLSARVTSMTKSPVSTIITRPRPKTTIDGHVKSSSNMSGMHYSGSSGPIPVTITAQQQQSSVSTPSPPSAGIGRPVWSNSYSGTTQPIPLPAVPRFAVKEVTPTPVQTRTKRPSAISGSPSTSNALIGVPLSPSTTTTTATITQIAPSRLGQRQRTSTTNLFASHGTPTTKRPHRPLLAAEDNLPKDPLPTDQLLGGVLPKARALTLTNRGGQSQNKERRTHNANIPALSLPSKSSQAQWHQPQQQHHSYQDEEEKFVQEALQPSERGHLQHSNEDDQDSDDDSFNQPAEVQASFDDDLLGAHHHDANVIPPKDEAALMTLTGEIPPSDSSLALPSSQDESSRTPRRDSFSSSPRATPAPSSLNLPRSQRSTRSNTRPFTPLAAPIVSPPIEEVAVTTTVVSSTLVKRKMKPAGTRPIAGMIQPTKGEQRTPSPPQAAQQHKSSPQHQQQESLPPVVPSSTIVDDEVSLMYDPILACYYDPNSNKYYQLHT